MRTWPRCEGDVMTMRCLPRRTSVQPALVIKPKTHWHNNGSLCLATGRDAKGNREETMFWIIGAILHATAFAVLGFFVLFAARKAEGWLRGLGNLVGAWLYLLTVLAVACAVILPVAGGRLFGITMPDHMGSMWMRHWQNDCPQLAPGATPTTPAMPVPPAKPG